MKKVFIIASFVIITIPMFAQKHVYISQEQRNRAVPWLSKSERMEAAFSQTPPGLKTVSDFRTVEEEHIGITMYDLQTQASISNRIYFFDDHTLGAVFTMGVEPQQFNERGTGYNFFNGTEWGAFPDTALETVRTGWPVYQPFGENGEIVVSHISASGEDGLVISMRPEKFQGEWLSYGFSGPTGFEALLFPQVATGGPDNSVVHMLTQIQNVTLPYQEVMHAPLYSRSVDGLLSWTPENLLLDPFLSIHYTAYDFDQFNLIADEDFVAILYGDFWNDLGLLKSEDGGDSWDQTIIWEHPYPHFNYLDPYPTDTFYCVDGAHHLAFDEDHQVHVVFSISRAYADEDQTYWFPAVDGIIFWKEERPTFSNNLNALSPYGDPGTELVEDYNLIGWSPDLNTNGQLDILGNWGQYYLGFSSMPQIVFWDWAVDWVVIYSSVTESYNNGIQDYRHLWSRSSPNGEWWGPLVDLTGDNFHIYDECVFPSVAANSDGYFHLVYQKDTEPGMAVRGDEDPYGNNCMTYMKVDLSVGILENNSTPAFEVTQNFPNPFSGKSFINIIVKKETKINIEIIDILGQLVYSTPEKLVQAGNLRLEIDAKGFTPGVYFYTVRAGQMAVTKKMIVE